MFLCVLIFKCLIIGATKTIDFPFVSNKKNDVLGVPIFKHISEGISKQCRPTKEPFDKCLHC